MRIVIAGGSGFLGLNLARHLAANGHEIVMLSRGAPVSDSRWRHAPWDGRTLGVWAKSLDGADAIVNFAGQTVDCVKTPDHCDEFLRSHVESTRVLGLAVREEHDSNPPSRDRGTLMSSSLAQRSAPPPAFAGSWPARRRCIIVNRRSIHVPDPVEQRRHASSRLPT